MSFSYMTSIGLVALAMIGVWTIFRDIWRYLVEPHVMKSPSISLLLAVKDKEAQMEEIMYYLAAKVEQAAVPVDVVVIDCGSTDLTPSILAKLAPDYAWLTIIYTVTAHGVEEALPVCRGSVIYVFDLVNRLKTGDFFTALCRTLG